MPKYKRDYGIDGKPEPTVYCSECSRFKRDTEGLSFRTDSVEYFMGVCLRGYSDCGGNKPRVFADKPRKCKCFKTLPTTE